MLCANNQIFGQTEYLLQLDFVKNGTQNNCSINSTYYSPSFTNNNIHQGLISMLDDEKIRLYNILPEEEIEIRFMVENVQDNNMEIGLSAFNTDTSEYKINIISLNEFTFSYPGFNSGIFNYNSNDLFIIRKCNNKVGYYLGSQELMVVPFSNMPPAFETFTQVNSANQTNVLLNLIKLPICSYYLPLQYNVINTRIPTTTTFLDGKILRFQYIEKYAIVEDKNDMVKIVVYNQHHNEVFTTTLNNQYGSNFHEVDLSIISEEINNYLVEFSNINKGQKYYLRIKELFD